MQRSGRNAGRQTGMYSVPASGKFGLKRWPLGTKTVWPASTSRIVPLSPYSITILPLTTQIHSS